MKNLLILTIIVFMTSCATVRLDETYKLEIKSNKVSKVQFRDSVFDLPAKIEVYRSSKPINLTYTTDSIQQIFVLKPILHPNFIYGNIPVYSIGYFVDLGNSKRYYYGKTIILNLKDSVKVIREPLFDPPLQIGKNIVNHFTKEYPTKKGKLDFTLSFPIASNFEMRPLNEGIKKGVGFGFSLGLDYYYKKNKYLSLNLTAFANRFALVGYLDDCAFVYESLHSSNIGLSDNFKIKRFSLGYGLSFSKNTWVLDKLEEFATYNTRTKKSKIDYNLGFIFTSYYQVFKCFYVGLNYRPTVLQTFPNTIFKYNHVFGMDYQFRF